MRSPLHPKATLVSVEIEKGFSAFRCPTSKGYWIPLQSYHTWRTRTPVAVAPLPEGYEPSFEHDSTAPLFCPESGCLLHRYRVGQGLPFRIDRSPKTGGIWLDEGEWQALKSKGLHDQLHLIFTAPYQRHLRTTDLQRTFLTAVEERLGTEDFQKVTEFKSWMSHHPEASYILSFLQESVEDAS